MLNLVKIPEIFTAILCQKIVNFENSLSKGFPFHVRHFTFKVASFSEAKHSLQKNEFYRRNREISKENISHYKINITEPLFSEKHDTETISVNRGSFFRGNAQITEKILSYLSVFLRAQGRLDMTKQNAFITITS